LLSKSIEKKSGLQPIEQVEQTFSGGSPLTRDESKTSYAVVRYNFRTYAPGGVLAVVKGRETGEKLIQQFEACQSAADRQEGWRCFLERTDMKPGLDPQEATNLRQTSMELRESEGPV
jgi:hypothetical protein